MAGISFSGITPAVHRRHAAAAPRGDRADVGHRRPLHRDSGYPGGIFNDGLRARPGSRSAWPTPARPGGGQPWARVLTREGDKHCIANQELRLQTAERAGDAMRGQPVPHAVALRPALAGRVDRARSTCPTFLVGQFQDEQTGGHFPEASAKLPATRTLDLDPERRPRRLARAEHDDPLGRVPQALRRRRGPEHPAVDPRRSSGELYRFLADAPAPRRSSSRASRARPTSPRPRRSSSATRACGS